MIKIAIVDDQILFSESLMYMLKSECEFEVVAIGKNGKEAIEICKKYSPDILLLDIMMEEMDGISAANIISKDYPNIKIIMLTTFEDSDSIICSMINGVNAFLVKDINPKMLIAGIKSVNSGLYVIHESAYNMIVEHLKIKHSFSNKNFRMNKDIKLSENDIDIIKQLAMGKNNKEIANALNFSEGTIKNRVSKLLNEFEVKDRSQIVVMALKNKLI